MSKPYTSKHQANEQSLADEFTALLEALGVLDMIGKSAPLTTKFDRIYTALSREDERRG